MKKIKKINIKNNIIIDYSEVINLTAQLASLIEPFSEDDKNSVIKFLRIYIECLKLNFVETNVGFIGMTHTRQNWVDMFYKIKDHIEDVYGCEVSLKIQRYWMSIGLAFIRIINFCKFNSIDVEGNIDISWLPKI